MMYVLYWIYCDGPECRDASPMDDGTLHHRSASDARADAKREGMVRRKGVDGRWLDLCHDCAAAHDTNTKNKKRQSKKDGEV